MLQFISIVLAISLSTAYACISSASSSSSTQSSIPILSAWKKCNGSTNNIVNNVQFVKYSDNYVYTYGASIPDYSIGPWLANPKNASDQQCTYKFPRNPTKATNKTTASGHIGQWINGVLANNALDAQSYNNLGIWNRNAYYWEGSGFDSCNGHPGPVGEYHIHVFPKCIYSSLNSTSHSPILGFAFDGYPIYGPYAYSNPNDTSSSITRMKTGFKLRSITSRQTLANGTTLTTTQFGPSINSTYPLGAYVEDYEYSSTNGDLDENNGRFCKTPEYPNGTYAYFTTIDTSGNPEYPFVIGPYYYGVPESLNIGNTRITITESVTTYFVCGSLGQSYYISILNIIVLLLSSSIYQNYF